jgi:cysteinyl-tRNA synthetase
MQIYNSLSKTKEEFKPLDGNTVRIYACGPTVYDLSHLGHARMCIIWDVIQRYLRFKGYDVILARNITDVDDKIINRAKELRIRPEQLARKYLFEFWRDMDTLNIQAPDFEPQATDYLKEMIGFIQGLIDKGKAYVAEGDVYFDVGAAKKYGQLTRQNLEDMMAGSRDQVISQADLESRKKHPADFALWKGAAADESGWTSPWGHGRPGWHIECSTMIKHVLGETIDLHGGGEDLLFPHHENEIAQSEGLHNKPLARFWVHNSFVYVNSEKMAKSLGNFSTIRDVLKDFSPDDIRLFVLQTHYRNPIDFTPESLQASKVAMQRLVRSAQYADDQEAELVGIARGSADAAPHSDPQMSGSGGSKNSADGVACSDSETSDLRLHDSAASAHASAVVPALVGARHARPALTEFHNEFTQAMDNDFNTAQAIALLFGLSDKIAKTTDKVERQDFANALKTYAKLLGFTLADTRKLLKPKAANELVEFILNLRADSKKRKDYATSDLIRSELTKQGITVMDTPDGATWEAS